MPACRHVPDASHSRDCITFPMRVRIRESVKSVPCSVTAQCTVLRAVVYPSMGSPGSLLPYLLHKRGVLNMCRIRGKFITHNVLMGL